MSVVQHRSKMHSVMRGLSFGLIRPSMMFRILKGGFKVPRYQNTYRLESFKPFKVDIVDKILKDVMYSFLIGLKYHPIVCLQVCKNMSAEVRDRIFKKSYDRYKYTVVMTIIQNLGQSADVSMACLWDAERDSYSTYVVKTNEFIALGLVIGTYYE
ncbi:hypothetical protein KPH14_005588 [Odynerus spinipes]|uniref:Uncharacterized protein n=1 Tax=Odynerus spinipes TaxID=1348599 RepID=A0AAD9RAU2_9HYME|nr:hypothetical protein KPH14_005588 [Odynerus spinipes]